MANRILNGVSFTQFGTLFEGKSVTVAEAFQEAKLDYTIGEQPLLRVPANVVEELKAAIAEGRTPDFGGWIPNKNSIISSHKATYREDADLTMGIVGAKYGVVQNTAALQFIDFIGEVAGVAPQIISAGALGYGERIFITCQVGDDMLLSDRDIVKPYIVFTTSHDGSGAVGAIITNVRVVCQNTLNMALRGTAEGKNGVISNKIIFKHTLNVNNRLDWSVEENRAKARQVFEKAHTFNAAFLDAMHTLQTQQVDSDYVETFVGKMLLSPALYAEWEKANRQTDKVEGIKTKTANLMLGLRDAIDYGIGQDIDRGSKMWLLNGVTTWLNNDRADSYKSQEDKFNSLQEGTGYKYTQKAYDLLTA